MTLIRTVLTTLLVFCAFTGESTLTLGNEPTSGNPIFPGWYADPEVAILDGRYWVFPTRSLPFDKQTFFDCFSSEDLVSWKKHEKVLKAEDVKWARRAMWAPSIIEKEGKFYFFFGANDVHEGEVGGIGVAVADKPEGPYHDLLGKPLINEIVNGAQPISLCFKTTTGNTTCFTEVGDIATSSGSRKILRGFFLLRTVNCTERLPLKTM